MKTLAHFRANVVAWIFYSPLQIAVVYLVWTIVFQSTDRVGQFAFRDILLYYLIVHFLDKILDPVLEVNYQVWEEINEGRLDIYMVRPINFTVFMFFKSLGIPIIELMIGIPFFLVFALVLNLPLQTDPAVLLCFFGSVAMGFLILYLVQLIIGTLTFWMEGIFGIRDIIFSVFMLFSGQLIPISVLPDWIVGVSACLPFEGIYFMPATIFAQTSVNATVIFFLAKQAAWVAVLATAAAVLWQRGNLRYASQGG